MKPCKTNFCGGNFQDWLEVMLIDKCNGKCLWCIERDGYRPPEHVGWECLVDAILLSKKRNIILLGGEPTMYKDLGEIVKALHMRRNLYITTNASRMNRLYIRHNLKGIVGANLSIHSFNLKENKKITGIDLDYDKLWGGIDQLHKQGASVRFNCNLIKGHIDNEFKIIDYITFVKEMGGDSIRFAELKADKDNFIDAAKILDYQYGLNDDPFTKGCHQNAIINDMPINFRQMCGLQTDMRVKPDNPEQPYPKEVLYYDGLIYQGWQKDRRHNMQSYEMKALLDEVAKGSVSPEDAMTKIYRSEDDSQYGCRY